MYVQITYIGTIKVNTHKPGSLGALVGKRVYTYNSTNPETPATTTDYTYGYDALGNVQVVFSGSGTVGQMKYYFTQDAFGNELSGDSNLPLSNRTNLYGASSWSAARAEGITEHQTGKFMSTLTGLYYIKSGSTPPL